MTDQELQAIRERCISGRYAEGYSTGRLSGFISTGAPAANTDVKALLSEVERLRAELASIEHRFGKSECYYCGEPLSNSPGVDDNHWRNCEKHPAKTEVERLNNRCVEMEAASEYWYLRASGQQPVWAHVLERTKRGEGIPAFAKAMSLEQDEPGDGSGVRGGE